MAVYPKNKTRKLAGGGLLEGVARGFNSTADAPGLSIGLQYIPTQADIPDGYLQQSGIYIILNDRDQRVYIGSAVCLATRWDCHQHKLRKGIHNKKLQNFVDKYGLAGLRFGLLELVSDKDQLIVREQFFIDQYQSVKKGFNIRLQAQSNLGYQHSEEAREKISQAGQGNKHTLGRKLSEEHRAKIAAGNKGRVKTPEEKARISAGQQGRSPISEETRQKMSAAQRKRGPASAETRAKLSAKLIGNQRTKGVSLTEEHKQKIRTGNTHPKPKKNDGYLSQK